jgi:hypothetical protein
MAQHDPVSKQTCVNLQGKVVDGSFCELVESDSGPLHMCDSGCALCWQFLARLLAFLNHCYLFAPKYLGCRCGFLQVLRTCRIFCAFSLAHGIEARDSLGLI